MSERERRDGTALPRELTDPSAAEFAATQRAWLEHSLSENEAGRKSDREHARTVAACYADAMSFLERFGDARPARRES